jgi:hypothetical protein
MAPSHRMPGRRMGPPIKSEGDGGAGWVTAGWRAMEQSSRRPYP